MATVKSHIFLDKDEKPVMVHAIYSDLVDEALTAGLTAEVIMAEIKEAPAVKELRHLSTSCKKSDDKYLVRAVLRYVPSEE